MVSGIIYCIVLKFSSSDDVPAHEHNVNSTLNLKNKKHNLNARRPLSINSSPKYFSIEGDRNGSHRKHFQKSYSHRIKNVNHSYVIILSVYCQRWL